MTWIGDLVDGYVAGRVSQDQLIQELGTRDMGKIPRRKESQDEADALGIDQGGSLD